MKQHLNISLCFLSLFFCLQHKPASARSIIFPVSGFSTAAPEPVPIGLEWDESWFTKSDAKTYNHGIARIACLLSEIAYVDVDKRHPDDELTNAYHELGVNQNAIYYHYAINYNDPVWGDDQVAFSIASKKIQTASGERPLIFIVIRGTPASAQEWISNANVGNGKNGTSELHEGFARAAWLVKTALSDYLIAQHIDPRSAFFLITGHSRGAATANMLTAVLNTDPLYTPERLYTYTFASPNVTTSSNAQDEQYANIWNIVNAEDIVPTVPLSTEGWNYHKYGHTLTIINAWNTDPDLYRTEYLPLMNITFHKLMLRDYAPFTTGPFIPVQISRVVKTVNSNVTSFYSGVFGLHGRLTKLFPQIFPNEKQENATGNTTEAVFNTFKNWFDKSHPNLIDYSLKALVDMHANETYLSWMLALDDSKLYSEVGSSELVLQGIYNCAVIDTSGTVAARILDGVLISGLESSIAVAQILPHSVIIGIPANSGYSIIFGKQSILPTPVHASLERYNSDGTDKRNTLKKTFYPRIGTSYTVSAGAISLYTTSIEAEKEDGTEALRKLNKNGLIPEKTFIIQPELSLDSETNLGGGFTVGMTSLYSSFLIGHNIYKAGKSLSLAPGIGIQQNLYGPIMINSEFYWKFVEAFTDPGKDDSGQLAMVPSARILLSIKPVRRMQFFAAGVFDFHIETLNDTAFSSELNPNLNNAIRVNNSTEIIPSIQFGIKF
jgi:hypothetical protein